jgi:hypothetical protein
MRGKALVQAERALVVWTDNINPKLFQVEGCTACGKCLGSANMCKQVNLLRLPVLVALTLSTAYPHIRILMQLVLLV